MEAPELTEQADAETTPNIDLLEDPTVIQDRASISEREVPENTELETPKIQENTNLETLLVPKDDETTTCVVPEETELIQEHGRAVFEMETELPEHINLETMQENIIVLPMVADDIEPIEKLTTKRQDDYILETKTSDVQEDKEIERLMIPVETVVETSLVSKVTDVGTLMVSEVEELIVSEDTVKTSLVPETSGVQNQQATIRPEPRTKQKVTVIIELVRTDPVTSPVRSSTISEVEAQPKNTGACSNVNSSSPELQFGPTMSCSLSRALVKKVLQKNNVYSLDLCHLIANRLDQKMKDHLIDTSISQYKLARIGKKAAKRLQKDYGSFANVLNEACSADNVEFETNLVKCLNAEIEVFLNRPSQPGPVSSALSVQDGLSSRLCTVLLFHLYREQKKGCACERPR
ncbi:hypothetical protein WMY93_013374 [Mugilogobius chulae]|uniref:Uncharacterized protein n=1 Tax=Mugilogobius chulae TaxID=88201 RepID=A0AAW0P1G5_9GOBI